MSIFSEDSHGALSGVPAWTPELPVQRLELLKRRLDERERYITHELATRVMNTWQRFRGEINLKRVIMVDSPLEGMFLSGLIRRAEGPIDKEEDSPLWWLQRPSRAALTRVTLQQARDILTNSPPAWESGLQAMGDRSLETNSTRARDRVQNVDTQGANLTMLERAVGRALPAAIQKMPNKEPKAVFFARQLLDKNPLPKSPGLQQLIVQRLAGTWAPDAGDIKVIQHKLSWDTRADSMLNQAMIPISSYLSTLTTGGINDTRLSPWCSGVLSLNQFYQSLCRESHSLHSRKGSWLPHQAEVLEDLFNLGPIFSTLGYYVVSQRPQMRLEWTANGPQWHNDGGPSWSYPDGCRQWHLHGTEVPTWLAETPAEQLDIRTWKNLKNADVRTEFVRKFGVANLLEGHGTPVDSHINYQEEWWTKSQYELWDVHKIFQGSSYQPYLRMVNQTTGVTHVEAVSPLCRTLADAIKNRFGGRTLKIRSIR